MTRPGNPMPSGDRTGTPAGLAGHGQPRPEAESAPGPPPAAARARTLVEGNSSAVLDIPGLTGGDVFAMTPLERRVSADGTVHLRMPAGSPALRVAAAARGGEVVAVLDITDVAPVATAARVRGRATVAGWIGSAVDGGDWLRLEPGELTLEDLWGTAEVDPDEFAAAAPDPLAGHEAELLQHLAAAHAGQLSWLGVLAGCPERCTAAVVPVALDGGGLRVRFSGAGGTVDARFEFPSPVRDINGLRRAMHELFDAARDAVRSR